MRSRDRDLDGRLLLIGTAENANVAALLASVRAGHYRVDIEIRGCRLILWPGGYLVVLVSAGAFWS